MALSRRLRSLLATTGPGSDPLSAVQTGEHLRSLLTNEITRPHKTELSRLLAVQMYRICACALCGIKQPTAVHIGGYLRLRWLEDQA